MIADGESFYVFDETTMSITLLKDDDGNNISTDEGDVLYPCAATINDNEIAYIAGLASGISTNKAYMLNLQEK